LDTRTDAIEYDFVDIDLVQANANSLAIKYTTVIGYLPLKYGNWLGLWEGSASPYNLGTPLATVKLASDSNSGAVAINDINLAAGQTYTLIYFLGEDRTTASAMIRFILRN
jgi:hypothetical protein